MNTLLPAAEMAKAVRDRDAAYNGLFYFAVRTTGIFCRPICPSRPARPENVEFFPSPKAAMGAGYRPCKRCRPLDEDQQPAWVSALLAEVEAGTALRIKDSELRSRGLDPGTVRRHFQKTFGMTFQAYARARRLSGALSEIREGGTVDDAILESGYESESGFREAFTRTFGAAPRDARERACVLMAWVASPLGPLVAGATDDGICLLEFTDRRMLEAQFQTIRKRFPVPVVPGRNAHLDTLDAELKEYFAGKRSRFTVPIVYPGTEFQQRVWSELLKIPHGETRSYEDLAVALGDRNAVRAVGRANGMNRIAIVIPCHRVVNKSGELGGYAGGLRRKQYLLSLERGEATEF